MTILEKIFKKTTIEQGLTEWSDKECLDNFMKFMQRISMGTTFVEDDAGFLVAEVLHIQCGEAFTTSPPLPFDWPLEPVIFPEGGPKKDTFH